jgi:hypothetical protein
LVQTKIFVALYCFLDIFYDIGYCQCPRYQSQDSIWLSLCPTLKKKKFYSTNNINIQRKLVLKTHENSPILDVVTKQKKTSFLVFSQTHPFKRFYLSLETFKELIEMNEHSNL